MSPPVRVALLGFTPFERQHIEPALRAPRRGKPVYQARFEALPTCNLAVVDADHEAAVVQVLHQKRLASVVMVGSTRIPGAGAQLPRPIHVPSLLQALDALVARAPPMSAEVERVQQMLASLTARRAPRPGANQSATPATQSTTPPANTTPPGAGKDTASPVIAGPDAAQRPRRGTALLVDGRDESLQYLARELAPLGLEVQRVVGGSEALERLQNEVHEFVFLATGDTADAGDGSAEGGTADGMDGFHTCRLLQRMPPAQPVAPPPTLVLLLAADTGVNRLRAERAGADAWLTPPWSTEALLKIVDERDRWLRQSGKRTG